MGGRSGSSGGSSTRVYDKNGAYIDLSESPLKYGQKDDTLKGVARAAIEAFENDNNKTRASVEYSRVVDKNGNIVSEDVGEEGNVDMRIRTGEKGQTGSHTHPKKIGYLGGTFSNEDIENFTTQPEYTTLRARAKEGTYSISKKENFDAKGLMEYKLSERKRLYEQRVKNENELLAKRERKEISVKELKEGIVKEYNKFLVNVHNSLLAGQKKYGYSYTLERPRRRK